MTIRKQFVLLTSLIFSFLIILSVAVLYYNRLVLSERKFMNEYFSSLDSEYKLSEKKTKKFNRIIHRISPDIELLIIADDFKIVHNSFSDFNSLMQTDYRTISKLVNDTSSDYYYHLSNYTSDNQKFYLISRNIKNSNNKNLKKNFFIIFHILISILIVVLILFLFFLFNNIFNSINVLKFKAEQIANGDLSQTIDIDTKSTANEISSLAQNLDRMRIYLIDAQNRRNRFVMGISHDLRTPVSVIKGYTEAINDGIISEPEDIKNTLNLITSKTEQLEDMIETLINYTKLHSSEVRVNMTISSINKFIENFAKYAEITGPIFKRKITSEIKLENEINLLFNHQLINRVFENLLSNAIRYSNDGDSIHISAITENNFIIIKIIDSGIGIGKDDLYHIFDLFYKASSSRKEQGFGVGLSVVKNILNMHGWGISVESELNVGTTFTIRILYSDTDIIPKEITS